MVYQSEKHEENILKRPLFTVCGTFFLTSVLLADIRFSIKALLAAAAVAVTLLLGLSAHFGRLNRRKFSVFAAILLSFGAALLFSLLSINVRLYRAEQFYNATLECDAVIEEKRGGSSYYGYYTASVRPYGEKKSIRILLAFPDGSCERGDVLHGYITFSELDLSGAYDGRRSSISDGIFLQGESESMTYSGHERSFSVRRLFSDINRKLSSAIMINAGDDGALSCAVLLGNKSFLDNSVRRDFSRLGISHLTAVSGLHLSVICASLDAVLKRLRVRGALQKPLLMASTLLYMGITGFSASVMRAGIMNIMRLTADMLGRSSDSETSLSLSACTILLLNPCAAYDAGLSLSVLSAYACIIYSSFSARHFKRRIPRLLRALRDCFLMTLLITVCTLPVMWSTFGAVSAVSPISNLIFIPAMTVFLYISALYLFLCLLGAGVILDPATSILTSVSRIICSAARFGGSFRGIEVSLNIYGVGVFVFLLSASVIMFPQTRGLARSAARCIALLGTVGIAVLLAARNIMCDGTGEIIYKNSGKNDGFVFRCGSEYIIADISDGSSGFLSELNSAAESDGAAEINTLLLTHYHSKHVSAVRSFSHRVMLRRVLLPYPENDKDVSVLEELCRILDEQNVQIDFYLRRSGESTELGSISFGYFDYSLIKRSTHPIIAFTAQIGRMKIVYLGGSFHEGAEIEEELIEYDTAFFGAHSPKYKSAVDCTVGGISVMADITASEADFDGSIFGGDTVRIGKDGEYRSGKFNLSE